MAAKKILFVCTGNTCRSPMAAGLFQQLLAEEGITEYSVESAGITAWEGRPPTDQAVHVLAEAGIDISGHRSRQLTPELAAEFDLIIAMTREHKAAVLRLLPQVQGKVFTLKELTLAPLLEGTVPDWGRLQERIREKEAEYFREHGERIKELQERREKLLAELEVLEGCLQDLAAGLKAVAAEEKQEMMELEARLPPLDVDDPFGQPEEEYRRCRDEIWEHLRLLLAQLSEEEQD